jgi:hypothetical protein
MRIRWLWAQKTVPDRPWDGLPVAIPLKARALFDVAVDAIVGNGDEILFWKDRWLDDHTLAEMAPNLFRVVPKRVVKRRTVAQVLQNRRWVHDIRGALLWRCCWSICGFGTWWVELSFMKMSQINTIGS